MHLAYSALRIIQKDKIANTSAKNLADARYQGYMAACKKHRQTIAQIRQYLPGWEPPLPSLTQTLSKREGL